MADVAIEAAVAAAVVEIAVSAIDRLAAEAIAAGCPILVDAVNGVLMAWNVPQWPGEHLFKFEQDPTTHKLSLRYLGGSATAVVADWAAELAEPTVAAVVAALAAETRLAGRTRLVVNNRSPIANIPLIARLMEFEVPAELLARRLALIAGNALYKARTYLSLFGIDAPADSKAASVARPVARPVPAPVRAPVVSIAATIAAAGKTADAELRGDNVESVLETLLVRGATPSAIKAAKAPDMTALMMEMLREEGEEVAAEPIDPSVLLALASL
jgi:hypothetical protein